MSQSLRLRSGGLAVTYVMQLPPCISALRCLSHLAIVPFNNQPQHSVNYRTYVRLPAELSALSRLTSLTVHDTMSPLAPPGCCQGLRRLHLHGDTSCDGALAQLSRLSSLQELVMRWSSLGAATTGGGGGDHPLPAARMLSAAVAIPLLQGLTRLEFSYCDLSDSHGINLLHRCARPQRFCQPALAAHGLFAVDVAASLILMLHGCLAAG